ncbi:MAG: HD domain-containing protein [Deltaproteobacteria bacterium]|nr:HD domain-containing protein [Deltaproteobacteria bacterium]MBW2006792.1 HD domain-containing protein [Deltaproteobacteria bacterium]MBW2104043.1 HD domain-containing protein [Deltaproteobacteria bacterium]
MLQELNVNFGNILLSLSDAMDIASPRIASHQMRTAFIAWKLALAAGLPKEKIEKIYLAAILHDIGALSLEEKVQLHAGFEDIKPETHCILGEVLFELSPILKPSARIVRYHHRPWKEWPESIDSPGVMESQILCLSDEIERLVQRKKYILHQIDDINDKAASFAGSKIHTDVIDVFMELSKYEDFWLDLASPRLYSILLHVGPFRKVELERKDISSIASIFRDIIDFKSRFTATHSTGVAECAVMLSRYLGFTEAEVAEMEVAGYFHDLGKLAVPNSILEKPGKLTKEEFEVIKQHTYFTYSVLATIGGLGHIAEWAAFHHEKLDGSGYPFHIAADRINLGARILAVADIFTALSEDRPYRKGMGRKEVEEILKKQTDGRALDGRIVDIVLHNIGEISSKVKLKQNESADIFEMRFVAVKDREN